MCEQNPDCGGWAVGGTAVKPTGCESTPLWSDFFYLFIHLLLLLLNWSNLHWVEWCLLFQIAMLFQLIFQLVEVPARVHGEERLPHFANYRSRQRRAPSLQHHDANQRRHPSNNHRMQPSIFAHSRSTTLPARLELA
jgi:hypothetical protein